MITKTQIKEFRKYLKKSENPLFFYDDDPDGLCSYLILKKYINKGKGAILRTTSVLDLNMYHKVEEYSPDLIIALDIPIIDQEFINKANVPILWLDHHTPLKRKGVHYFNPKLKNKKAEIPTTHWAYEIAEENDLFLATLGNISDWNYPKYAKDFSEKYPDILPKKTKTAPEAIFTSKLGELINLLAFSLKKPTSKINKMVNLLLKIEDPYELLKGETPRSKFIHREVKSLLTEYNEMIDYVKKQKPKKGKLFLVELPKVKNSYSSLISNYLIYKYPKKVVIVSRRKTDSVTMSIRSAGTNVREALEKSLEGLNGFGGGHDNACGAGINKDQYEEFIRKFNENIK